MEIARVYFDCNMLRSHEGLGKILTKSGIDLGNIPSRHFFIFMNRKMDRFKLMFGGKYILYYRHDSGRIPLEAIRNIPRYFDGRPIGIKKAIEATIVSKLSRRKIAVRPASTERAGFEARA